MEKKICSVKGCNNKIDVRGLCNKHYQQARRLGKIKTKKTCKVKDCDKPVYGNNYCHKHYKQMRNHGKIFERTRYDPNQIIEYNDCLGIVLKNNDHVMIEAIIDKSDYSKISKYKWFLGSNGYPIMKPSYNREVPLHKILNLGFKETDHIDRNPLNNKRNNLRECTQAQNVCNHSLRKDSASGVTGVSWNGWSWIAYISKNHQRIYLGSFNNFDHAVAARQKAEKEYFGEFAPR